MFGKKDLYKLIIPLMVEQMLAVTVGMIDIAMVSGAGEAAISGVSLVDTINILIINVLTALATGGAVVCAQYLGHKDKKNACTAGNQLLLVTGVLSFVVMIISLLGNKAILDLIYGNIDADVLENARSYFYITALSFPFLGIYNSCAALYRSMGNSKISMKVSLYMNGQNVIGNIILIYGFNMAVQGAALSTLAARVVAAGIMLFIIRNPQNDIHIDRRFKLGFSWPMIRRILGIGIPNGLENSMFQFGKILVAGLVTSFGSASITANAVAGTFTSFGVIPGMAIGLALVTVVGQCVGAGDWGQARKYTIKLIKVTYIIMLIVNIGLIIFATPLLQLFQLSAETEKMAREIIVYHSTCCVIIWPLAFTLANSLRASNDVKFTMVVSILSMWVWRIGFSYIIAKYLGLGVIGVWIAMTIDWAFRSIFFTGRFISKKKATPSFL